MERFLAELRELFRRGENSGIDISFFADKLGVWEHRVVDVGPINDVRVRILGIGAYFFDDSRRRCRQKWVDGCSKLLPGALPNAILPKLKLQHRNNHHFVEIFSKSSIYQYMTVLA